MVFDGVESLENPGASRQVKKWIDGLFTAAHLKIKPRGTATRWNADPGNGIAPANRGP
jgi:hypothetical protein